MPSSLDHTLYFTKFLYCVRNLLSRHVWHSWRGAVHLLWVVWPQTRTNPKAPSCPPRPWPLCWPVCSPVLGKRLYGVDLVCLVFKLNEMPNFCLSQSEAQLWLCLRVFWLLDWDWRWSLFHTVLSLYNFVLLSLGACPRSCRRRSWPWLQTAAMSWIKPDSHRQG